MYDTYSREIYYWLVNNKIADKVDSILSVLQSIQGNLVYILITCLFILLVVFIFKFMIIRGRNL